MREGGQGKLESVWRSAGARGLRRYFSMLAQRDYDSAVRQINDEGLKFPVLFLLAPEVEAYIDEADLSPRNEIALKVIREKLKFGGRSALLGARDMGALREALVWMVQTGKNWQGTSPGRDDYDAVIDYAAGLLAAALEDSGILPDIIEMMFSRNRRGEYIHDLAWSFFQAADGQALEAVAGYLLSQDERDVELACRLLGIDAAGVPDREKAREIHRRYLEWLYENRRHMYLTRENFQMTSRPQPVRCDLEAKYLGREISLRSGAPVSPLTAEEHERLKRYRELPPEEREALSEYSHSLRERDERGWREWMGRSVREQVMAAMGQDVEVV